MRQIVQITRASDDETPEFINHFNWGACLLPWIWAIGNRSLNVVTVALAIGAFIPYVSLLSTFALAVYSGRTGNRRAWAKAKGRVTEELFVRSQRRWARAGWAASSMLVLMIILSAAMGTR
jgi:hypothetical protein